MAHLESVDGSDVRRLRITSTAHFAALPPHSAVSLRLAVRLQKETEATLRPAGGAASLLFSLAGEASLTALCCGKAAMRSSTRKSLSC